MATQANFAATPRASSVLVNTADSNTDGTTGTRATVFTAGANGSRVDALKIKGIVANGTTQAADSVRIWVNNGTTSFLFAEQVVPVGSGNVSVTVGNVEYTIALGFPLPASWQIQVSTVTGGSTASYHATCFGGDF